MNIDHHLNPAEQYLLSKAAQNQQPIYGSLELLPLCNLNCDMCYVRLSGQELDRKGRLRTSKEWLILAEQMRNAGVLYLQLTGGEPLLYPEFKDLYLGLQSLGMILTINTNGTLMDDGWIDFFAAHKPRRINISLYGTNEEAYSVLCHHQGGFQKVIDGIQKLQAKKVDVKLNAVLTASNKDQIEEYFALSQELNVPLNIDTYLLPASREREKSFCMEKRLPPQEVAAAQLKILSLQMGEKNFRNYARKELDYIEQFSDWKKDPVPMECMGGNCSFVVNWQGILSPCIVMTKPGTPVFETGFENGWKKIRSQTSEMFLPKSCACCRLRSLCRVCVASASLEEKDETDSPKYLCSITHALFHLLQSTVSEK